MNISIEKLFFSYPNTSVLEDISFTAESGKTVAVLGTNGAGKTTLLKCINRILRCSSGKISVNGKDTALMKPDELAKTIGYVPQKLTFSDSTVFDAVLMGRKPYIRWEASAYDLKITEKLIEENGLTDIALSNVNEISGGEQQKVAVARALAQQPGILIFDEPTSNLDIKNQLGIMQNITDIAKANNITVIVTMHDINLALRFADEFILLKDKRIHSYGTKDIITPASIKEVYGLEAEVVQLLGKTVVIPK